jgi:hypothetical protein
VTELSEPAPAAAPTPDNPYTRLVGRLEHTTSLDGAVEAIAPVAGKLVATKGLRDFFNGTATGVPPHVILTDLPLGAWFLAQYLDLFDDEASRVAARRLVALGLVAAGPTAWTGWARWVGMAQETRRVGVVHAVSNGVGILTFLASWVARRQGQQRLGANLARAGSVPLIVGGFLGGHMGRRSPLHSNR